MGNRRALIIGNINYNSFDYLKLESVEADVNLMEKTLERIGYSCQIEKDVSYDHFEICINDFLHFESESDDVNIIYYSGHGCVKDNHLCFVTIDDDNTYYFELENVVRKVSGKQGYYLIIVDACRSGEREYTPSFDEANCYVMYATDTGRFSYIDKTSFFTETLCRNMLNAGIGIGELFSNTKKDMEDARYEQRPVAINGANKDFVVFPVPFEVLPDEEGKKTVYTIDDIDEQISNQSNYRGLGIDFFELDDKTAELKIEMAIEEETIHIVGKSREETLYRVLYILKKKYTDRPVFIIQSNEQWEKLLASDVHGCILFPFFYSTNTILAKKGNTNIYIFDESDSCLYQDKIVVHRRTLKNIYDSLCKIGLDARLAERFVTETNGYYNALYKRLFCGVIMNRHEWLKNTPNAAYIALMCGMWTDTEADHLFIEKLSGCSYNEYWNALEPFYYGSDPLIIQSYKNGKQIMQVAAFEDIWEELHERINKSIWDRFDLLFTDQIKNHIKCDQNDFKMLAHEALPTECSSVLKEGIIRTMVMRACRSYNSNQNIVDGIVGDALNSIVKEKEWVNLSDLILDLCEASPEAVLKRLEHEIDNNTGLSCLFPRKETSGETYSTEYLNYLWSMEYLLQQNKYAVRAVEWLWKADDMWQPDEQKQTTIELLERAFCPWMNTCALSVEQKTILMKKAVKEHTRTWNVLIKELPSNFSSVLELARPKYRQVEEQSSVTDLEYIKCIKEYYAQGVILCADKVERWKEFLDTIDHQDNSAIVEILGELLKRIDQEDDAWKHSIKEKIRHIIFNHRSFIDADWYMGEEKLALFEKTFSQIMIQTKEYEYLYLFYAEYDFPLLHPSIEEDSNDNARDKEIKDKFIEFKRDNLKIDALIRLACAEKDKTTCLGKVLAQYYCEGKYNKYILDCLILYKAGTMQIHDYIVTFMRLGENIDLKSIIESIDIATENIPYISTIVSLDIIKDPENALLLQQKDIIKHYFWKNSHIDVDSDNEDTYVCLLNECYQYGTFTNFIDLLYESYKKMSSERIIEELNRALECSACAINHPLTQYYIKEILEDIRSRMEINEELRHAIAVTEWKYRDILKWEDMKCFQQEIKRDPSLYAELVNIIYKKEGEEKNEEKQRKAQQYISIFWKTKFCPGETNGKVEKDVLQRWADGFRNILQSNKQGHLWGHLIGKLLAYAPAGKDGYIPCEEVREFIEKNATDKMLSSFETEVFNKRGGHFLSAGENERVLSEKCKTIAEKLNTLYPQIAKIYYQLSDTYMMESEMDRKQAEDDL